MEFSPSEPEIVSYLPALPEDVYRALPALDQAELSVIDGRLNLLVANAKDKGFSDRTVESIFALRGRLYAERAGAWKLFKLFDQPLDFVEKADDQTSAQQLLNDRVTAGLRDNAESQCRLKPGNDEERKFRLGEYRLETGLPHFEEWARDNGLSSYGTYDNSTLAGRIRGQYRAWLEQQVDTVVGEAAAALKNSENPDTNRRVVVATNGAINSFRKEVFGGFDSLFQSSIDEGLLQVQNMEPVAPDNTETISVLGRIARRVLGEGPTVIHDRIGREHSALSDFFSISQKMTQYADQVRSSKAAGQIIGEYRQMLGIDKLESAVYERLHQLVNKVTANLFLDQFEDEIDDHFNSSFGRTGRSNSKREEPVTITYDRPDGDHETVNDTEEPVIYNEGRFSSTIRFNDQAVSENNEVDENMVAYFRAAALKYLEIDGISDNVVREFCRQAFHKNTDEAELPPFNSKKMMRRFVSRLHTDVTSQESNDEAGKTARQKTPKEIKQELLDSQISSWIFGSYKDGVLQLSKSGDYVEVVFVDKALLT